MNMHPDSIQIPLTRRLESVRKKAPFALLRSGVNWAGGRKYIVVEMRDLNTNRVYQYSGCPDHTDSKRSLLELAAAAKATKEVDGTDRVLVFSQAGEREWERFFFEPYSKPVYVPPPVEPIVDLFFVQEPTKKGN